MKKEAIGIDFSKRGDLSKFGRPAIKPPTGEEIAKRYEQAMLKLKQNNSDK